MQWNRIHFLTKMACWLFISSAKLIASVRRTLMTFGKISSDSTNLDYPSDRSVRGNRTGWGNQQMYPRGAGRRDWIVAPAGSGTVVLEPVWARHPDTRHTVHDNSGALSPSGHLQAFDELLDLPYFHVPIRSGFLAVGGHRLCVGQAAARTENSTRTTTRLMRGHAVHASGESHGRSLRG